MNNSKKVSIAVAVMNRTERIVKCLSSWAKFEIFNDIVLVDWSTNPPILSNPYVKSFVFENKIKVIRVDNEKYFSLPKAFNLAIDNTINENILKIDIDYILTNKNFINQIIEFSDRLDKEFFICTNPNLIDFFGMVLMKKQAFNDAGGYNELLAGWGYDDIDLYNRLKKNLKTGSINNILSYIYHNPHDDNLRVANYEIKDKNISHKINIKISNEKKFVRKKMKLYSFCNSDYESLKEIFLKSCKDDYEIIIDNIETDNVFGSKSNKIWCFKTKKIIEYIEKNYGQKIIFCDIDIQFFKPTIDVINSSPEVDILFQFEDEQICIGFMVIKCNQNTKTFFEEVLERCENNEWDQDVIRQKVKEEKISWALLSKKIWCYTPSEKVPPLDIVCHHATWAYSLEEKLLQMKSVKNYMCKKRIF